ncbi:glycosyltransferase 61 family protein [Planktothrix agardhii]|uniref:glycosyltransferase 61 family protein n=1 Tax=Planktothrix agardhii TaxID=1160 RepID=UPI001F3A8EAE|nr:glycosyltransferase 61 family protein [Planktothrix agardhii]MCF3576346.1 glycosyltransferase 61 family protein [Planktothrix agardhii 1812]
MSENTTSNQPLSIPELQSLGHTYLGQQQFLKAISVYEQCILESPDIVANYWYLGLSWLLQGDVLQAQTIWFSAFAESNLETTEITEFVNFLKGKAREYLSSQSFEFAQLIYEAILEWCETDLEVYDNLGHTIALQGDLEAAIRIWQKGIELEPNSIQMYLNQANIFQKLEQFEAAIQCYQEVIKYSPDHLIYYQLGLCLTQIKQWESAINAFENAIQLQPNYAPAYSFYPDPALILLQQAQDIAPNNFLVYLKSGDIFYNYKQDYVEAFQCYLAANLSDFLSVIDNTISWEERQARYHLALGKCRLKLNCYQQAVANFKTVIDFNYNLVEAYYGLGQALFHTGEIDQAIDSLKECLKFDSKSALYSGYLGFLLIYNNQIEAGLFYLKKAMIYESSVANWIDSLLNNLSELGKLNTSVDLSEIKPINPPIQFDQSTEDWLKSNPSTPDNYQQIYPATIVNLKPPKSLDNSIHFSFRFGQQMELPAAFVLKIPQGRFWLSSDQTQSAILTQEQHFLGDLSPEFPLLSPGHPDKNPSQHSILSLNKLPPIYFINGTVAILAGLSNSVYFHWMLDVLPRIELLKKSSVNWNEIDYFIVDNRLSFQKETLEKLQIPPNKQININEFHHLQAQTLIVPSFPGCAAWMPPWTCNFLKQHFLHPDVITSSPNIKRIYITRNAAKSRRILNEDELLRVLQPWGFHSIKLESMSVIEQAGLFSQAEIIIAPHGSGLTNLVFCQPNTKVIELFSPNYVYHCYWWISNLVELDYYYYIGETFPGYYLHRLVYPQPFSEDILVNIQEFLNLLVLSSYTK